MHNVIDIRTAECRDAGSIAELVRRSLSPHDLETTIYGCPKIARYLTRHIETTHEAGALPLLVAEIGGTLTGFIELRRYRSELWLNYIVVDEQWRGLGVGGMLLSRALNQTGMVAGSTLVLHVFEHNTSAREWYTRLGFERTGAINMFRAAIPCNGSDGKAQADGMPQADLCHEHFGFSSFTLTTGSRSFPIGRLGNRWFRVTDPDLLTCPDALHSLSRIDARRELLVIVPENADCSGSLVSLEPVTRQWRMESRLPLGLRHRDCELAGKA